MKKVFVHINKARVSVEVEDDIFDAIDMLIKTEHALERRERYHCAYHIESCQYHGQELSDTEDVLAMLANQQRMRLVKAAIPHMPSDQQRMRLVKAAIPHMLSDQQRMLVWLISGIKIVDIAPHYGVDYAAMLRMLKQAVDELLKLMDMID